MVTMMRHTIFASLTIYGLIEMTYSSGISVCYYRNWAQYGKLKARFLPENIDPELCSVIDYAQMVVDLKTHKLKGRQKNDREMLQRLNKLKQKEKGLRVFISVGGASHDSTKRPRFSKMVQTLKTRRIFINSVIEYLTNHKLDGVSLDWEYPALKGSPKKDKSRFVLLLKEMRKAFETYAQKNGKHRFGLTLAVSPVVKRIKAAYDIKRIAKYVDWVNVMAYNLRGPWRKQTGCPTLMNGKGPNVPNSINNWIKGGMPASKINLGLVGYGRTFKLASSNSYILGAQSRGSGIAGRYTKKRGLLAYYEICQIKWTHKTSTNQSACSAPYASRGNRWCGYDDPESIRYKVRTLVKKLRLNGISMYALDFDDFSGTNCNQGKYPLLRAAVNEMNPVKPTIKLITKPITKPSPRKLVTSGISVCYYRNWAQYGKLKARFLPEDIDPQLCSVINYAQMVVDLKTHKLKGRQKNDKEMLQRLNKLKEKKNGLKLFISVGGWNHEKVPRFSKMVQTIKTRRIFINSVIKYLTNHTLDGVSLDWEYPALRGSPKKDKSRFVLLLKEMRKAFDKYAQKNGKPRFGLTLAVSPNPKKIKVAYDIKNIDKYVDWVNIMAYNLRGPWRKKTGCPTLTKGDKPNIPDAIDTWVNGGMPPSKINLGLVSYGRTFRLASKRSYGLGARSRGSGFSGRYTKKKGILAYYEICRVPWMHKTPANTSACGTPYASINYGWCAYDNPASIRNKMFSLVVRRGLNGISMWALDFDDFSGTNCNEGKYPLLRAAVSEMRKYIRPTVVPITKRITAMVVTTNKPTTKPTMTTKPQPITKSTTKPTAKPTTKPTTKPTIKPTTKQTTKLTTRQTTKPTTKSIAKPTTKLTTKQTTKPTTKSIAKPTTKPTIKPTTKQTTKLTIKPTTKPTTKLTTKQTTKPTTKSSTTSTMKSTTKEKTKPRTKPTTQSTKKVTKKPTTEPTGETGLSIWERIQINEYMEYLRQMLGIDYW